MQSSSRYNRAALSKAFRLRSSTSTTYFFSRQNLKYFFRKYQNLLLNYTPSLSRQIMQQASSQSYAYEKYCLDIMEHSILPIQLWNFKSFSLKGLLAQFFITFSQYLQNKRLSKFSYIILSCCPSYAKGFLSEVPSESISFVSQLTAQDLVNSFTSIAYWWYWCCICNSSLKKIYWLYNYCQPFFSNLDSSIEITEQIDFYLWNAAESITLNLLKRLSMQNMIKVQREVVSELLRKCDISWMTICMVYGKDEGKSQLNSMECKSTQQSILSTSV